MVRERGDEINSGKVYFASKFEQMHTLHLGLSKLLNICSVSYVGSKALHTRDRETVIVDRIFLKVKCRMLRAAISYLLSLENRLLNGMACGFQHLKRRVS